MLLLCLSALSVLNLSARTRVAEGEADEPELFIQSVSSRSDVYEREAMPVVVTLFSTSPDVASAAMLNEPSLHDGEFSTFQKIEPAGRSYTKVIDSKKYYCFPLYACMVSFADKGKYKFEGGKYNIGISIPTIVNDPFWGKVRSSRIINKEISANELKINVKRMPDVPSNIDFTGSVGQFMVETIVPKGDIIANREAVAYIVVRGSGIIEEQTLPQYHKAFSGGLRLKSVSESRNEYFDNGKLVSELQLECTFVPETVNDFQIGEASFDYFDPVDKKFKSAKSKPVTINVKSSVKLREKIEI